MWLREILDENWKNLKIIHIVRDPRGSLDSMERTGVHPLFTEYYCPAILDDLTQVSELQKEHPAAFLTVRYEDLCLQPYGRLAQYNQENN